MTTVTNCYNNSVCKSNAKCKEYACCILVCTVPLLYITNTFVIFMCVLTQTQPALTIILHTHVVY